MQAKSWSAVWRCHLAMRSFKVLRQRHTADAMPGNVWPQPDLIATHKLDAYKFQQEFRLGFCPAGALDFGNITAEITTGETPVTSQPHNHKRQIIQTGDLADICSLHKL